MNIESISQEALLLPAQDRARLAEQLLESLATLSEVEAEQLWFQESARRAAEVDKGRMSRVPAHEVMAEVRAMLK